MSTVSVRIYGQEYKISGEKSEEYIRKVAQYIDQNMRDVEAITGRIPQATLAVLASVNTADELFETQARLEGLERINAQNEKDLKSYQTLWDDAQRNLSKLKEDSERVKELENSFFDLQMENLKLKSELDRLKKETNNL